MDIGPAKTPAADDIVKDTTTTSFMKDVVEASRDTLVLVDFWAAWCGPCKQLAPVLEKVVRSYNGRVKLVKLDTDAHPSIAAQLRVQSLPTVYAFRDGRPLDGFVGLQTESMLREFIDRLAGEEPSAEPSVDEILAAAGEALEAGDLFVALKGERFDGHAFVPQAFAAGAAAAMVAESAASGLDGDLVVVPDPQRALGRLARAWRERFDVPLALVVGSNGKTTVKEMIARALAAHFGAEAVLATAGNLNNAIGLPLTLLGLRGTHRAAVVELGMNHRGETAELAAIARPTIAVVNNAQREHQEFMKSVAEVAEEHADAILALPAGGVPPLASSFDRAMQ